MNNQMSKFYPDLDSKIECRSDTVWFKKESYIAGKHSHNKMNVNLSIGVSYGINTIILY